MQVWNLTNCKLKTNHYGHNGYLNCVTVSPDGSLCASGGKDGQAMLWDLNEGKHLYTLDGTNEINALVFSPNRYWLCAATGPTIKIWVSFDISYLTSFIYLITCRTWRVNLKLMRYVLNKYRTQELSIVRLLHGQQMDRHYLLVILIVSYEYLM